MNAADAKATKGGDAGATKDACARLAPLIAAYRALTPDRVPALLALYAPQARFRDPFNDVRGRAAIGAVLAHMFATLDSPRFVVTDCYAGSDGQRAVLRWEFAFASRRLGGDCRIVGLSEITLDADGLVVEHLDYWDPAAGLYERLPLLGGLFRRLRRALAASG